VTTGSVEPPIVGFDQTRKRYLMKAEHLQRHGGMVPRYTSYPTAPHFHDGITPDIYRQWLSEISPDSSLSLYFHVPFCHAMCWYCGCHTKVVNRYDPIGNYASLLKKEFELVAPSLPEGPKVTHVHWGGGTPTILSAEDFTMLMETMHKHVTFSETAEVAVEIDPRTLSLDMIKALAAAGVNRASLGIQDFNDNVQQAINRIQTFETTKEKVDSLRANGIQSINFDLMYGLPLQTIADVQRTVDLAIKMRPDRLSIFGYAHVPWMKTHQKKILDADLPGDIERMDQADSTAERLVEHGYVRIGLDHFAHPEDSLAIALKQGKLERNFQGYTNDGADNLIGFGSSAIGNLKQGYIQNQVPFRQYGAAIEAGEFPIAKGIALNQEDYIRRQIIERLMCDLEVNLEDITTGHSLAPDTFDSEIEALQPMQQDQLLEITGRQITVNEEGRHLIRSVCAMFDTYLKAGKARHSKAV